MLVKFDPPLDPRSLFEAALRRQGGLPEVFPLAAPNVSLHFSGRYALAAAIRALALPEGAAVLLPAYNCGTEVEPFVRAGLAPRFYRVGRDLCADLDDIEACLNQPRTRPTALLLTHYFGLPQPRLTDIAGLCRERGVSLIEDCAHALLAEHGGRPLGSFGAAAVFSLIKALPLPDGAALVVNGGARRPEGTEPPAAVIQHLAGRLLRHNQAGGSGRLSGAWPVVFERLLAARLWASSHAGAGTHPAIDPRATVWRPEAALWRMSRLSRRLLAGCDLAGIKAARRRNYLTLLDHFRAAHPECLLSPELPGGACPLCFPVRLRRPPALFARSLAGRGVEGWPWWQEMFHPAAPWAEFPEALALKKRVLALPVHQGLGPPEMEAVIRAFEAAWRLLS